MSINLTVFGHGPALVFFHGWGFDHSIWFELADRLKTRYTVYLVDLPGFGRTAMMNWSTFKQKILDILPTSFAVVGWSMGGLFATRLAVEERSRVSHLFNMASSPRFLNETDWPGIDKKILDGFLAGLIRQPEHTLEQFIRLQLLHHPRTIPLGVTPSMDGLTAGLDVLAKWDLRSFLSDLAIPICYVFGRLDSIVSSKTLRVMQKRYPHVHCILLAKSAHAPFLTHPLQLMSILDTFLTTNAP